jgi:hypothetical protein
MRHDIDELTGHIGSIAYPARLIAVEPIPARSAATTATATTATATATAAIVSHRDSKVEIDSEYWLKPLHGIAYSASSPEIATHIAMIDSRFQVRLKL